MATCRIALVGALIFLLAACGGSPAMQLLKKNHNELIIPADFGVCKGYGCRYYLKTGLTPAEWERIEALFGAGVETPAAERDVIKRAIALFERFVGPKTGTDSDDAGAQIINFSTRDQMDCIDEAFNSSTYLYLLRKVRLIRHHTLGKPLRRGNYFDRWPHNTATIHEIGRPPVVNGEGHYVVDSWFHVNGAEPEIVPARQWSKGWSPDKK